MTTTQLTPAQHAILTYALEHTDGKIDWFPDNIKGGARKKVLDGLFNRALITAEGYAALGRDMPAPAALHPDPEIEAPVVPGRPRTRENSKQATVIQMLQRPEGASIAQICSATGWQSHTVRGTFAGAFKKKLGLNLTSDKTAGGERIYRIA